ncbi:MAG: LamG domain-containing protein [Gammaproteobacteria bacterium]|jgi:hypothetical protein
MEKLAETPLDLISDAVAPPPGRQCLQAMAGFALALLLALLLTACGGGASTETNPVTSLPGSVDTLSYTGPNAQTEDIRAFQVNVWERLRDANRCGACHLEGGQVPMFVRQDDVNLAYSEANSLIDLDSPDASRLVTKVAEGHNCWLSSVAACATAITSYIEDWAEGVVAGGRQIQLVAPVAYAPGATLGFPAEVGDTDFESTVWPLLRSNCQGCHVDSSPTPQQPFFASDNVADAYEAVKSKISLNEPGGSRLVVRLRDEFHNCWSQCDADATAMESRIVVLAASVPVNQVQSPTIFSDALKLPEGIVAAGGNRHETDLIAQYEFKTGSGNVALDTSGVLPELNLTLSGDVDWVGGWGIDLVNGRAQGSTTNSRKLHDLITATGEYSVEAWVAPANVTQEGPARIVSYSAGTDARNFTLGQTQYNYDFLHRSSTTDGNGQAALSTADADEDLQATLQHVVLTFDPINGRRIYVNGEFTGDTDPVPPGNLNDWNDSFALVLGNEASGDRPWAGTIRLLAIHNRALTQTQIQQNFDVGVGEKFFLLFGIGDLIALPQSYIMFEVAQYDNHSYLFHRPTFVNLDPAAAPVNIPIKCLSIGINGSEAPVGQAYRNLDTTIDASRYDPAAGQVLSELGTVIALENGPDYDEFFLTFEVLGSNTNVVTENSPLLPPPVPGPGEVSDIGLRTFDEINATMAAITGVEPQRVRSEFESLRQQLPAVETIEGFLSAHQMAIAQLSIAYCHELVEDRVKRADFFGFADPASGDAFFNSAVATAFTAAAKDRITGALFERMSGLPGTGAALGSAPTRAEIEAELIGPGPNLFDRLEQNCSLDPGCNADADRTRAVVKAMCAATLGGAGMLVQ